MATTPKQDGTTDAKQDPKLAPKQQGDVRPGGQMTGSVEPDSQQGQPIYRDWAAI